MSTFNSHATTRTKPRKDEKVEPGATLPDGEPKIARKPRNPLLSQTDLDKERADGEGMIPNKPAAHDEP